MVTDLVAAIFASVRQGTFTFGRLIDIITAAAAGETSGGKGTQLFKKLDGLTDEFSMDADDDGNRTNSDYAP